MKMIQSIIIVFAILSLTGCKKLVGDQSGIFRDRTQDYRFSKTVEPLEVPEDMQQATLQPFYPLSDEE